MKLLNDLLPIFKTRTNVLEFLYLYSDLKPVIRQGYYEEELDKLLKFCKKNNLYAEVSQYKIFLADTQNGKKNYSNKGIKIKKDDPRRGLYFVYISKNKDKAIYADTFDMKNDNRGLGTILGYPKCCVDFFAKNASSMAQGDNDFLRATVKNSKEYRYPFYNNIAIRGQDITLLNHFPCSFGCKESIDIAKKNLEFLKHKLPKTAEIYKEKLKGRILIHDRFFEFV